jgi:putative ABC transport system permease protein
MLLQDLRYGLRVLRKSPAFTAVAAFTIALGVGANTALFSIVDAVLFRPLPYEAPDRLVMIWDRNLERSLDHIGPSPGNFLDWRERLDSFEGMAAWYQTSRTLRGEHDAEQANTVKVAGDFFPLIGTPAALGKTFSSGETEGVAYNVANQYVTGERVLVISDGLWRRRFGASPDIIGQTIMLDGLGWQVLGVMPPGFAIPDKQADIWIPWDIKRSYGPRRFPDGVPRDFRFLDVLARLKPGVTIEQAQARMDTLAAELAEAHPKPNRGWGASLIRLHEEMAAPSRRALLVLFGAVGFVLAVACANVASLLLARGSARQREIALRASLGASRTRLVRQLLTESLLLSLIGSGGGLLLAWWGLDVLVSLAPGDIPRIDEAAVDARVLSFTLAITSLSGILFGIAPALHSSRADLTAALKEGSSRAGSARHRLRSVLVAGEIAVALVLLIGAGLFLRSFARVISVDPGFNPESLLAVRIFLDNNAYRTAEQSRIYYQKLIERLGALPSVISVGGTTVLPMSDVGVDFTRPYWREGEADPGGQAAQVGIRMVTLDYFRTMEMTVIKGRSFDERDRAGSPRVIMVNETLAREAWPGEEAPGKRLIIDYLGGAYAYEVVGLVADTRYYGLKSNPHPEVFIPHVQNPYMTMNVALRTSVEPETMAETVRREVLALDPAQPVHSIVTMEQLMAGAVAADRFVMLLLAGLGGVALVLASVGVYGVMAYSVSRRTHEIGVRVALGARGSDVLLLVMGESFKLTVAGLVAGVAGAMALGQVVGGLLYGVSATDPATFAVVSIVLAMVAMLAGYVPARRAMRVDPMVALRCE